MAIVPVIRILYYCFSITVSRGHIVSGLTGTFSGVPVPLIIMYFSLVSGAGTLATAFFYTMNNDYIVPIRWK